jgi:hypothetical protein
MRAMSGPVLEYEAPVFARENPDWVYYVVFLANVALIAAGFCLMYCLLFVLRRPAAGALITLTVAYVPLHWVVVLATAKGYMPGRRRILARWALWAAVVVLFLGCLLPTANLLLVMF